MANLYRIETCSLLLHHKATTPSIGLALDAPKLGNLWRMRFEQEAESRFACRRKLARRFPLLACQDVRCA
jgi:hypothetical protein